MSTPGQESHLLSAAFTTSTSGSPTPVAQSEEIPRSNSIDNLNDPISSPVNSNSYLLPAKSISQATSQGSTPVPSTTSHTKPRIVGGFEIDDDDEEEDEEEEENVTSDEEDEADVYDPAANLDLDFDTPAPNSVPVSASTIPLDRTSLTPDQENGITPAHVQVHGSPAGNTSSALPTGADTLRAATATPNQYTAAPSAQPSPPRLTDVNDSLAPALPKTRLAHDVVGILQDRINDDPRGDSAAYLELIQEFKDRNKHDDVRRVYDQYLSVFPLAAEQWCAYVKFEEEHDRKHAMETLFSRSLLEVLDVQLWSLYINYIRRRNSMQTGDVAKSYKIINDSFSFALKTIGMDKDAGNLWLDYINFLKTGPGIIGGSGWQDAAKVDSLREAYQKAIAVPTAATTTLWKEYDAFETGLSKINGRKYLQEKSPSYMTARTAYTQLQNITKDLQRTSRPQLPPSFGYAGHDDYLRQVALWKQWIQWEIEDPLVLKDEDLSLYHNRILFTYKQALMALQFWPELWYDAVEFCLANGLENEGVKLLGQGIAANPESPLLAFKLADRIESSTQNDETSDPGAKERMKKIREPYDRVLDALYDLVKKVSTREKQHIQTIELSAVTNGNGVGAEAEDINAGNIAAKKAMVDSQIEAIKKGSQAQADLLSRMVSYVWIALMRATRRVQGKGLPTERGPSGFRAIFGEARKRGKLTSDFYVESARIEWQCYRDPTGTKILERGMKLFPEDDYLPLQYIKHLVDINDITNARAVFETTVKRLLAHEDAEYTAKAKPLFSYFHDYESKYGELAQVQSLEERMRRFFPEDPTLKLFRSRYSTSTFDPTQTQPVISQRQVQVPATVVPSVEIHDTVNSPIQSTIDNVQTNSPKRPFPDDFDDAGPRKFARAESPLKGAAGRRMNQQAQIQQQQQQAQPPPSRQINPPPTVPTFQVPAPLPPQITYLLSILPKASLYVDLKFDPRAIFELIRDVHLPPPGSINGQPHHVSPQGPPNTGWPTYPQQQHQAPPMPPQGFVPPPGVTQGQYGGSPFRFA